MKNKNEKTKTTHEDLQREIAELRQAERALKAALAKAEDERNTSNAIIDAIGYGIIIQDTDYKILYQNKIQNDLYGNRVGEYCYKTYEGRNTICEDCPIELSFKDGKVHKAERRVPTDDGILYTELTGSSLKDSTGNIIAGVKVVRDITERKLVEEKLRKGELFLENVFASIQDGIGIIDKDMNILHVNPTAERWYPHAAPLIGRKCYEAYHGRSERCEECPAWKTLKTGESAYKIVPKHGPGGKEVGWLEIYSFPMIDTATREMRGAIEYVRDITERKRVEKEKDRLLKAIDSSTDGITIADENDRYIYVNAAYAKIFGYSQEEFIGETWRKITPSELIAPTEKELSRTMRNRDIGTFRGEAPGLRKDGTIIPTEVQGTALWDENGDYLGHICIVRDIAERKRMEETLMLFSEAVENAPDGVQIADLDGHIIYSNKATEEIYGFSPEEFRGKHVNEMNADPEIASKAIIPSIRESGRWVGELMVKHKNGRTFPVWLNASMVKNSKGKPIAMIGIIRDIKELRRAEEELNQRAQQAMLGAEVGIALTQRDTLREILQRCTEAIVHYLNAALVRIWTFNQAGNYLELQASAGIYTHINGSHSRVPVGSFKIGLIAKERKPHMTNSVIGDPRVHDQEWAKREGMVAFAGYPLIIEDRPVGVMAMFSRQPLTDFALNALASVADSIALGIERKQTEEAIKKYAKELEDSNRMKELFMDIMHHDLINPLTAASGFIELLKEDEMKSQKRAYLETIERNLVKALELMESATKLSKLEGSKSIELVNMDLEKVINEVTENMSSLAEDARMKIENKINISIPVRANKIIEEVFANIISNAIKYASSGKRIILDCEENEGCWNIRVMDFGEGIEDGDKIVIFDRFHRMEKKGVKGSGLGLAIASKIMELHNGRIWVEDNPEGGAVFIVEIEKHLK